jgi:hypothetical protein
MLECLDVATVTAGLEICCFLEACSALGTLHIRVQSASKHSCFCSCVCDAFSKHKLFFIPHCLALYCRHLMNDRSVIPRRRWAVLKPIMREQRGPDSCRLGYELGRQLIFPLHKIAVFFGQLNDSQLVKTGLIHINLWHINAVHSIPCTNRTFISCCIWFYLHQLG